MDFLTIADDSTESFKGISITIDEDIEYIHLVNIFNNLENGILIAQIKSKIVSELARFPQSIDLLYKSLLIEKNMLVRKSIITSFFIIGGEEVVRLLVPLLSSEDANLRNSILETLHSLPEYVEQYIKILLNHSDENVRIFGIEILSSFPDSFVVDLIFDLIKKETNINVCIAIVERLLRIEGFKDMKVLEELIDRFPDESFLKYLVDIAIGTDKIPENNGN